MTVEATPLSGEGNAYVSLPEADEFSLRVADLTAWSNADDATRGRALVQAADEIDTLRFAGTRYDSDQARQFPRFVADTAADWPAGKQHVSGVTWDLDDDGNAVVPNCVKFADFLQAMSILRDPERMNRQRDRHDGLTGQSAGGFNESYDPNRPPAVLCLEAMQQLKPYLLKTGRII